MIRVKEESIIAHETKIHLFQKPQKVTNSKGGHGAAK